MPQLSRVTIGMIHSKLEILNLLSRPLLYFGLARKYRKYTDPNYVRKQEQFHIENELPAIDNRIYTIHVSLLLQKIAEIRQVSKAYTPPPYKVSVLPICLATVHR